MSDLSELSCDEDVKKSKSMKRSASSASVEDPANQVIIIFSMFLEITVEFHYLKL